MLERVELFINLKKKEITALESFSEPLDVAQNTVVINEGERTDSLFVIIKGRAYAYCTDNAGRQLVVNRFGPFDYFGEMSFFDGKKRSASVATKEDCSLLVIPRQQFMEFTATHPQIYWNVSKALVEKLRKATQQIEELAFVDVYSRLTRFLTENQDENGVLSEKFTQQELADIVGATRETICRIFNDLASAGYLVKQGNRLVIVKPLPYKL